MDCTGGCSLRTLTFSWAPFRAQSLKGECPRKRGRPRECPTRCLQGPSEPSLQCPETRRVSPEGPGHNFLRVVFLVSLAGLQETGLVRRRHDRLYLHGPHPRKTMVLNHGLHPLRTMVLKIPALALGYRKEEATMPPLISCTRLRVPPVALHASRYTCRS